MKDQESRFTQDTFCRIAIEHLRCVAEPNSVTRSIEQNAYIALAFSALKCVRSKDMVLAEICTETDLKIAQSALTAFNQATLENRASRFHKIQTKLATSIFLYQLAQVLEEPDETKQLLNHALHFAKDAEEVAKKFPLIPVRFWSKKLRRARKNLTCTEELVHKLLSASIGSPFQFRDDLETALAIFDSNSRRNESPESWKWEENSRIHREKFMKLFEYGRNHPKKVKEVNGVRVCCSEDFLIGKGAEGTRVYVGLGRDGYERAVKRLPKDSCSGLAEQEKQVLNRAKSNNVVNYWFLDDKCSEKYLYLILDLCEETLHDFVQRSSLDDLETTAPDIIPQILKGLADLHREPESILHRDLKPSNILRNVDNKWLLADFGISLILPEGASSRTSTERGTKYWRAVESYPLDGGSRYKKKSDIQVAGMVAFYTATKGEHAFGEEADRLRNLLDGKPVGLDKLKDPVLNDLLSWMLSHDPKDRPSAEEALRHPYLQPKKQQFEMLCKVGSQPEIKTRDAKSDVVRQLNSDHRDWRSLMNSDVLKYLSTDPLKGYTFRYKPSWTDCLRLIRNVKEHWNAHPRPRPKLFYVVGDPQEYFLNLFPKLPVVVHEILRSCDWKERPDLKEYFS